MLSTVGRQQVLRPLFPETNLHGHRAQYQVTGATVRNRPLPHKLLTINNYVKCPSKFAFAHSSFLFHPPIFEKILIIMVKVHYIIDYNKLGFQENYKRG